MPRKSKITRMAPDARAYIEKVLREDRLTLDEMIADLGAKFPSDKISRSSLHRYQSAHKEITERIRAQDTAARAIVAELGENPDERAGALLMQSVTTAMTHVALRMNEEDEATIDDVRKLARAAKDTLDARGKSLKERQAIRQEAREELVREQRAKLDALGKSGEVPAAMVAKVIAAAYGNNV